VCFQLYASEELNLDRAFQGRISRVRASATSVAFRAETVQIFGVWALFWEPAEREGRKLRGGKEESGKAGGGRGRLGKGKEGEGRVKGDHLV